MGPIGMPEMVIIAVIALIIFGPRKLPELGRSLGKSIAEFKRASNELKNTLEEEIRMDEEQRPSVEAAKAGQDSTTATTAPTPNTTAPKVDEVARPADHRSESASAMALVPFTGPQSGARQLPPEDDDESLGAKMSFLEHLDELRKRIINAALSVAVGIAATFWWINPIFNFLLAPTRKAL